MGVFSEVYHRCPKCGDAGYMQIKPPIGNTLGEFDLENKNTLRYLTEDELIQLYVAVRENTFTCCTCRHTFNPFSNTSKDILIKNLFPGAI